LARSSTSRRAAWFDAYVQAVLQRDMRDLANIEQLTESQFQVQCVTKFLTKVPVPSWLVNFPAVLPQ
jgi:hypothetical protein